MPKGAWVGNHSGVHSFTLGQRKSLGVAVGKRAYVAAIEPESGTVRLGEAEDLRAVGAELGELNLASDASPPFSCEIAVRYRSPPRARKA